MKTIKHFIDGKSFLGNSKRTGKVFNPATGEQSAEVKLANVKMLMRLLKAQKMHTKVGQIHLLCREHELCLNLKN